MAAALLALAGACVPPPGRQVEPAAPAPAGEPEPATAGPRAETRGEAQAEAKAEAGPAAAREGPKAEAPAARGPVRAARHMVAAANPLAAEAGLEILRKGGSAVDATVAMQMVLTLVEPQSSGIGGGGFLVYYDAQSGDVTAFDGRETAPASAHAEMFLHRDGTPMDFYEAVVGGLSVGVPGTVRMLEMAQARYGRLPWPELFAPAIRLAEQGFPVSPRLHALIAADDYLDTFPETAAYFYHSDGSPRGVGEILDNKPLARTLRAIAEDGSEAFYSGPIARDIARTVRGAEINPGGMTEDDLIAYTPKIRRALCRPYRAFRVCGMPPPSSGAVAILQALGLLEDFDLAAHGPGTAPSIHLIAEASRLAFADRNAYLADPDFVPVPTDELLDSAYLDRRAARISLRRSMGVAEPGRPARHAAAPPPGLAAERPSTTHMSVVDAEGNALAFTSSIENAFGSRLMVRGFLLNNQLTDFSFLPATDGHPVANRAAPGKRPLSSMSPTLVFDSQEQPLLAVGSPGGKRIIGYVLKTLIAVLDWNLDMQRAIDLPHFVNLNAETELEEGTPLVRQKPALEALGHEVRVRRQPSGLQGIRITGQGLEGGADSRREGVALGD